MCVESEGKHTKHKHSPSNDPLSNHFCKWFANISWSKDHLEIVFIIVPYLSPQPTTSEAIPVEISVVFPYIVCLSHNEAILRFNTDDVVRVL